MCIRDSMGTGPVRIADGLQRILPNHSPSQTLGNDLEDQIIAWSISQRPFNAMAQNRLPGGMMRVEKFPNSLVAIKITTDRPDKCCRQILHALRPGMSTAIDFIDQYFGLITFLAVAHDLYLALVQRGNIGERFVKC